MIRKYSLDELLSFWNVLKGDMFWSLSSSTSTDGSRDYTDYDKLFDCYTSCTGLQVSNVM